MPQVPEERPQPHEVPWREVEHQEEDDYPDDWMHRSYPVGHAREWAWYGSDADAKKELEELRRLEKRRATLGGFGFRA